LRSAMIDGARTKGLLASAPRSQAFWAGVVIVMAVGFATPPIQNAVVSPDSESYLNLSSERMPVYTVFASALGDGYALVLVQFLLSLAAWCWLGWVVARAVGVLVAGCLAVSGPVLMWDLMALSESLTLTLLIASLAATISLCRRWSRARFVVWCVGVGLFAMTRATNMFLLPFFVVPFIPGERKRLLYVAAAALIFMVLSDGYSRTAGASLRRTALVNVYTGRLLIEPRWQRYFIERGMPIRREMEPYVGVGRTGRENARALFEASPEFEAWFDQNGVSEFYRWLFAHPKNFALPAIALVKNLDFMNLQYAGGTRVRAVSAYLIWFYAAVHIPWWVWLTGLLLPFLIRRLEGRVTPDSLFVPALMVGIYAQAYVGYHGDRAEVSRHVILALVLYKVTILLMLASVVSAVVGRRRRRGAAVPAKSSGDPRRGGKRGKT
jgi:hypothetical protein